MKRREFGKLMGVAATAPLVVPKAGIALQQPRWSITADIAESCSCDVPCSCNFGRPERVCHGSRLYQIREGQFEGADLAGINFVVSFHMANWTRIYMDDALSAVQTETLERLLPVAFAGFDAGAQVKESVPLNIQDLGDTFEFSVPESVVRIRLFPGIDGSPITISGLPNSSYYQYVQYESVVHNHDSESGSWSHSSSNGFRSVMRASG